MKWNYWAIGEINKLFPIVFLKELIFMFCFSFFPLNEFRSFSNVLFQFSPLFVFLHFFINFKTIMIFIKLCYFSKRFWEKSKNVFTFLFFTIFFNSIFLLFLQKNLFSQISKNTFCFRWFSIYVFILFEFSSSFCIFQKNMWILCIFVIEKQSKTKKF